MNKVLKGILIALAVIACIILIPPMILKSQIDSIEDTPMATDITDTSLAFDNTYEIAEGDIKIQVPTHYASTKVSDYSAVMCVSAQEKKELMLIYYPFGPVADTIMPGYSKELEKMFAEYEESKPKYPWTLILDVPDDLFEVMRDTYLADKTSYKFWDFKHSLNLYHFLYAREKIEEQQSDFNFKYVYERDGIRAFAIEDRNNPGTYVVMIFPKNDPEDIYAFVITTNDADDITKLLNTFEYNSLF